MLSNFQIFAYGLRLTTLSLIRFILYETKSFYYRDETPEYETTINFLYGVNFRFIYARFTKSLCSLSLSFSHIVFISHRKFTLILCAPFGIVNTSVLIIHTDLRLRFQWIVWHGV